jgi:hypothetical protein
MMLMDDERVYLEGRGELLTGGARSRRRVMMAGTMGRTLLACALCFAIALLGVSGVHAHLAVADHAAPHAEESHLHHGAYVVSVIDADHVSDHDDDGDIDIDPVVKAFGKLLILPLLVAVALCYVIAVLARGDSGGQRLPIECPLRPPRQRSRFFLLPPAHAPPSLLS